MQTLPGLIIRTQSGFFTVETSQGPLVCQLRGRLKQGRRLGDVAALGDHVQVTWQPDGTGSIDAIEPRQRMLVRLAPTPRGEYQQILIANLDQAVFVFASANPAPRVGMLDRFLVIAEKQAIPALIVVNKTDLMEGGVEEDLFEHYPALGYQVIYTSTLTNQGLSELVGCLQGKISALAGPSGVGKSSLLNAIQPGLGLAAREVSKATAKGRHTTVARQLYPLVGGGYLADMPGLKSLALWDTSPEELDGYFPELREQVQHCQFNDCTHRSEPGCAVLAAVAQGAIHPKRYRSYLRMRYGGDED